MTLSSIMCNILDAMTMESQYEDFQQEFEEINTLVQGVKDAHVIGVYQLMWYEIYKCKGALWDALPEMQDFARVCTSMSR